MTALSLRVRILAAVALVLVVGAFALALSAPSLPAQQTRRPFPVTPPVTPPAELMRRATPIPGETDEQKRIRILRQLRVTPVSLADRTRGQKLTIGARSVQLPPDAYVEAIMDHVTCVDDTGPYGITPTPNWRCPEVPAYEIVRGMARLSIGIRTGRINSEQVPPDQPDAFRFVKVGLR